MRKLLILAAVVLLPHQALAFYQSEEPLTQEIRGMLYGATGTIDSSYVSSGSARLMYDAGIDDLHFEFHHLWSTSSQSRVSESSKTDRLNLSYSNEQLLVKVGRQPINLTRSFFFTPNDFFKPFSALAYNKDFKTGVDAFFSQLQISGLSNLSAYVVDESGKNRRSGLVEYESVLGKLGWSFLAGEVQSATFPSRTVIGGSVQTDLFDALSLRAEGHISDFLGQRFHEWVVGASHLWSNELNLTVEYFHHGARAPLPNLPYIGGTYLGAGLSFPYNPLLQLSVNMLENMDDRSRLYSAVAGYSLSGDTTVNLYLFQPSTADPTREFGQAVSVRGVECLFYF